MSSSPRYYQESGSFDAQGIIYMAVGGALTAALGGVVYGYWAAYIPIIILSWVGTFAAPAAVGFAVGQLARLGNVRCAWLAGGFGLLAGLALAYSSWVFWIYANFPTLVDGKEPLLAAAPGQLWALIQLLGETYSISIGKGGRDGLPISGWVLQGFWLIETGILVLGPSMLAWSQLVDEPFCEPCHRWIEVGATLHKAMAETIEKQKAELEAGRLDALYALPGVATSAPISLEVELRRCTPCSKRHYLTVRHVVRSVDEKGAESFSKTALVTNMEIGAADYQGLVEGKKPDGTAGMI